MLPTEIKGKVKIKKPKYIHMFIYLKKENQ